MLSDVVDQLQLRLSYYMQIWLKTVTERIVESGSHSACFSEPFRTLPFLECSDGGIAGSGAGTLSHVLKNQTKKSVWRNWRYACNGNHHQT